MNVESFYGSKKKQTSIRPLPEESDDSELDSTTSDEDWTYDSQEEDTSSSSSDADEMYESDESNEPSSSGHQVQSANKPRWRSVPPGNIAAAPPVWLDSLPPPLSSLPEPLEYFLGFLTEQTLLNIVTESNRYAIQENPNKPLNLTMSELQQFIGILFYMSFLRFPSTRMYWSKECRFPKIADIMSVNRFECIKSNIHINNNDEAVPRGEEGHDRLFKVRPLLSAVLHEFNKLPLSENLCVDEQIIPFKGKSTLKQYMPKKPKRWGYKLFVLSDVHGIMYNFESYTGKIHLPDDHKVVGVSGHFVLSLAEIIPHGRNYKLFFDNWFTSPALQIVLAKKGIQCIGTVRTNRITGCTLLNDKALKKRGRGSYVEMFTSVDGVEVRAIKWYDNRAVTLLGTFSGAEPAQSVSRYDKKTKSTVDIQCPSIVLIYNKYMGGVDLLDALLSFYRISLRSKKWYHKILYHILDLCCINGWLLYRRHCLQMNVTKKEQLSLLGFKSVLAESLCSSGKTQERKRGRPSTGIEAEYEEKKKRGPTTPIPPSSVRRDNTGHWPVFAENRGRCKYPSCKGAPKVQCVKCNLHLCFTPEKNCFLNFHTS